MIVLDTNVLSELARPRPAARVLDWVDSLLAQQVATTAITAAELLHGVARLPAGRRRAELADIVRTVLDEDLRDRVLPFDAAAATEYAALVRGREVAGRPVSMADAQIAAICRVHGAALGTRNVKDFEDTGVEIIDPWQQR